MNVFSERVDELRVTMDHRNRVIFVEGANVIEKNGLEIAREAFRRRILPGADVSGESAPVQALAGLWTQADIDAYGAD